MPITAKRNPFDVSQDALYAAKPKPRRTAEPTDSMKSTSRREKAVRELSVVFTPERFEHRTDAIGRPYIWSRGTVVERKVRRERTVMIQMGAYPLFQDLLELGTSLKISALRDYVRDGDGEPGAEIYRAREVLKVFDAEGREIDGETGRLLAGHERVGHYRRQHHGPGNALIRIVWIDATKVNGGSAAADEQD